MGRAREAGGDSAGLLTTRERARGTARTVAGARPRGVPDVGPSRVGPTEVRGPGRPGKGRRAVGCVGALARAGAESRPLCSRPASGLVSEGVRETWWGRPVSRYLIRKEPLYSEYPEYITW